MSENLVHRAARSVSVVAALSAAFLLTTLSAAPAGAVVQGTSPVSYRTFRLFGDAVSNGNTLMRNTASNPLVNSILLSESSAIVGDVPQNATVEGAFLFWSGSQLNGAIDSGATLTLADGSQQTVSANAATDCFTSPILDGFFYCHADVTDAVANHPAGAGNYNGIYTVGDVSARAATLDRNGQCLEQNCQAYYAGWSIVIVYASDQETTQRDLVLWDGFLQLDEDATSGITSFVMSGFNVPNNPQGTFRFFGLEGDALLGVPPQDQDPVPDLRCTTCYDFVEVNGVRLSDPNNPPGNLFNSTTPSGGALGVDIDTYDISSLVAAGDTQLNVTVGSGDGIPNGTEPHGGGESFFLGYVMVSLDRLAPNFATDATFKAVDPSEAGPGETLFFTVTVTNDGSMDATSVVLSDALDTHLTYVPGSTRVDGTVVNDPGGAFPLGAGLNLGMIPSLGDNDRRVTFRATVASGTPAGTVIHNTAHVSAAELSEAALTNTVTVNVEAPAIGTPEKTVRDVNGGAVEPGDRLRYTVFIPNNSNRTASGIQLVDDISQYGRLDVSSVDAGGFIDLSSETGGLNGTGRIDIREITIPAVLPGVFISYEVVLDTAAELIAEGVPPGSINGLTVTNQGRVQADFLLNDLLTDDPTTPQSPDATIVRLSSTINFNNPSTFKSVEDVNGGSLVPGDTLRYTISLQNIGSSDAIVNLSDDLPPGVENFTLETPNPSVSFSPAPAGSNGTGRLTATSLAVGAGQTVVIRFSVSVADDAANGLQIQNVAQLTVPADTSQNRALTSDLLQVASGASFETTTKAVIGAPPGGFQPGEEVTYSIEVKNSGNQDATGVRVRDDIALNLVDIRPADGGTYDAVTRRVTWDLGSLARGASRRLTLVATLNDPLPNGTRVRNQALVFADNVVGGTLSDDPATPAVDDATEIVVQSSPAFIGSTKTVQDLNGGDFEPGDSIRYVLTVTNTGRDVGTSVAITDPIAVDRMTLGVIGQGGRLISGQVVWTPQTTPQLATMAVGDSVTLTFEAELLPTLANGTSVSNQGFIASAEVPGPTPTDDPSTADPGDATVFVVSASPDLSGTLKEVLDDNGGAVQPGDLLTYTLTLANSGSGAASGVVVTDIVDGNLAGVTPADGGVYDAGSRTITWTLAGPVQAGDNATVSFRAVVATGTANGTRISNQGTITSRDLPQPVLTDDPRNGVGDDNPTEVVVETRPDFVLSSKTVRNVSGESSFKPGDTAIYTLVIRNTGTTAGTNVVVDDVVDASLTAVEPQDGGVFDGTRVRWTLASLDPGEVELHFRASVISPIDDGTVISNQAFVSSDEITEGVPTDDPNTEAEDDATVFVVSSRPILIGSRKSVSDVDGSPTRPGDALVYSIEVINSGTGGAHSVVVTDPIPAELEDIVAADGGVFDVATRTLTWTASSTPALAAVGAGESLVLTYQAQVASPLDNGTLVSNQATLTADEIPEAVLTDDPVTVAFQDPTTVQIVSTVDLSGATKIASDAPDGYRPGEPVTYTIAFTNEGDAAATGVVVTDALDPSLLFVSATDGGTFSAPVVEWSAATTPALASVAPGQTVELRVTGVLVSPLANGTTVFNQARIIADGFVNAVVTDDPLTPELDDPTLIVVTSEASLAASTKTVRDLDGDGFFEPGDTVEYALTVVNAGDSIAENVVVTDPIDTGVLSAVTPFDGGRLQGGTVVWDAATTPALAAVNPGDAGRAIVRFRATIVDTAENGVIISNQASASADGVPAAVTDDPTTATLDDATRLTVVAAPRFDGMTKTVTDLNGGVVEAGDRVRYTLSVTNDGSEVGRAVSLVDPVDDDLVSLSVEDGGVLTGQVIEWSLGDIPQDATRTLSFEATVRSGVADGTRILNQAELRGSGFANVVSDDPANGLGDDNPTVLIVNARPDLATFSKVAVDLNGGSLRPGDQVEYQLTLVNRGTGAARDVVVRDPIDTSVLTDVQPGQGARVAAGVVTWTSAEVPALAELPAGGTIALTVRVRLRDELPNGTVILNQANVTSAEGNNNFSDDPSTAAQADPTRLTVRFPEIASLLKSVRDVDGGLLEAGDRVEYTLTLEAGPGEDLVNLTIDDPVSAQLEDIVATEGGLFDASSRTLTWTRATTASLSRLPAGVRATVAFTARIGDVVAPGTVISNQATAWSALDPGEIELSDDPANGVGDHNPTDVTVEVVSQPDLDQTTKTVVDDNGGALERGDVLTYAIEVTNSGRAATGQINLVDPTPALTTYVSGTTTYQGTSVPDVAGQSPLQTGLSMANLESGQSARVEFKVRVSEQAPMGAIISNQGVATASGGAQALTDDPTTVNDNDATQIVVGAGPNITGMSKVATVLDRNGNGVLDLGESVEYAVRIANRGNTAATGVSFVDDLPANGSYVTGSLTIDGARLSDADDEDAGSIAGRRVTVQLGTLEPGVAHDIRFSLRADAGEMLLNQGVASGREFSDELTDADGNEANGDQPTITPIGAERVIVDIAKSVADANGGAVEPGDTLIYTVTLTNGSNEHLDEIRIDDLLPSATRFVQVLSEPPGAGASGDGQQATAVHIGLAAGQTTTFTFSARLAEGTADETQVCNAATASVSGESFETREPACVTVGGVVGSSRVRGVVFQDIGERNGRVDSGDIILPGFLVQVRRSSAPDVVVADLSSDEVGAFSFGALSPGTYDLRYLSQPPGGSPVEFGVVSRLVIGSGAVVEQNCLVDPSGRVYNSVSGDLVSGATVNIYYDASDDDPTRAGKLVAPSDLPEGQQGQLTVDGLYRFDVLAGHRYRLDVVAPNLALAFPSVRIPAKDRDWNPIDDPTEVVDNELPDLSPQAKSTYFLSFDIRDVDSEVLNNHIPLDPLSSLIQLDKRANKQKVTLGDIVTYTIRVTNRSNSQIVFDEASKTGGVYVRDSLPKGFSYVEGSARVRQVVSGRPSASFVGATSGKLTRTFGLADFESRGLNRPVPMNLGAGESVELRYQLVAGTDVTPGKEYVNRAVLVSADGSVPMSNQDTAKVRVIYDPIFDQGLLIGKVFCDANANGWQDEGEDGVYRARVFLDNGWYAVTDVNGQYHLDQINPGNHLLKIDENSLPAGGQLTTDVRRVFTTTRGLPTKVNFGTTCPVNMVGKVDVNESAASAEAREKERRAKFVPIEGNALTGQVRIGGSEHTVPTVSLGIASGRDDKAKMVKPIEGVARLTIESGKLSGKMSFLTQVPESGMRDGWSLRIYPADASDPVLETVRVLSGTGPAPSVIEWDGTDGAETLVIEGPRAYAARLTVSGGGEVSSSAPLIFAIDKRADSLLAETTVRGALWGRGNKAAKPTKTLESEVRKLAAKVPSGKKLDVVAEVHTDDNGKADKLLDLSQRRAAAVAALLRRVLALPAARVKATGFGGGSPLVPNIGKPNRAINRRVEIKVRDAAPDLVEAPEVSVPEIESQVFVNDIALRLNAEQAFSAEVARPADGSLVVDMRRADGSAVVVTTNLDGHGLPSPIAAARTPSLPIQGDVKTGTVNVGTRTFHVGLLGVELAPVHGEVVLEQGTLKPVADFNVKMPDGMAIGSYKFEVVDVEGQVVHTEIQSATVSKLRWAGTVDEDSTFLIPGWYTATLTVTTGVGDVGRSAPVNFRVTAPKAKPRRGRKMAKAVESGPAPPVLEFDPAVYVQGKKVAVSGREFRTQVAAYTGQRVMVEIRDRRGARAIVHLEVPPGFVNPAGTPPTPATSTPVPEGSPDSKPPVPDVHPTDGAPKGEDKSEGTTPDDAGPHTEVHSIDMKPFALMPLRGAAFEAERSAERTPTVSLVLAQGSDTVSDVAPTARSNKPKTETPRASGPVTLEDFGGAALDEALRPATDANAEVLQQTAAANLKVNLPPQGIKLSRRELVIAGSTDATNKLRINGQPVELDGEHFSHVVPLPLGESEILIETEDTEGNKGLIKWPVEVAEVGYFLMAFGDTAAATSGAELDGITEANSTTAGDVLLYGEAKVYLKGYMAGSAFLNGFFKEYKYTGYFDSSKQAEFEDFLTDTIQPELYYPIYGDSSEVVNDVNARGKLYIMVEADQSKLRVGNQRANLKGVQFFTYDKGFYGAGLDFNKVLADNYKTEVKAFVSDDKVGVQHTYNYLQGTGGSLYYLRHGSVLEGSEKIAIVIKDEASGVEVARIPQTRNVDYTLDSESGRLLFKTPVPSVVGSGFLNTQITTSTQVLSGNPVLVEVSYDYEADGTEPNRSYGGQVRETFFDILSVGGGVVEEGRGAGADPDYRLKGGEIGLKYTERTKMSFELAESESFDSQSFLSFDGGLNYEQFTRDSRQDRKGRAWIVSGQTEFGDLFYDDKPREFLLTRAYYQSADRGFFSGGTILEQGQDKFGGEGIWRVTDHNKLRLRHDGVFTTVDDLQDPNPRATKLMERQVTTTQYTYSDDLWELTSEYSRTFFDDAALVDGTTTHVVGQRAGYHLTPQLTGFVGQSYTAEGDARVYNEMLDRLQSDVGLVYKFRREWAADVTESYRWNGENATQLGLTTQLSDVADVYLKERLTTKEDNNGVGATSVVGGEQRFAGGSGRMYSEYQVDSGIIGSRNRAVMGIGKGFKLTRGLTLDVAYERSQISEDQVTGKSSRDVASVGWELLRYKNLKLTQKLEVRYDNADSATPQANPCFSDGLASNPDYCRDNLPGGTDKLQLLTTNGLVFTFLEDHNLLTRFNFMTTEDRTFDREEARHLEFSFGYALRPVSWDWFNFLFKYTYLQDMRPLGLVDFREERENAHVISAVPIFELPFKLQVVEKLAWKRSFVRYDDLPEAQSDTTLWINRLNYHLTNTVDAGVEYRFLHNDLADNLKHGALVEVSYILAEYARLGVGYNFTSFSDNELTDLNRDAGGFFFRVQGTY